ncbi:MAG: DNA repair exonuclease [bacterium]
MQDSTYKSITLVHTADFHLGRAFREMGGHGRLLRDRIRKALERTVETALERRAAALLVAGDLFDSPYPCREAMSCLASAADRLESAGVKIVVLPGTHDPPRSRVFNNSLFCEDRNLHLLTPSVPSVTFPRLDLAVCGWFPAEDCSRQWIGPPDGWQQGMSFCVGMAHGSVLTGLEAKVEDPIPPEVLNDSSIHYLALGHHHSRREIKEARAAACYSGSPEVLALDQKGAGQVLCVSMTRNAEGVQVMTDPVQVGSLRVETMQADAGEILAGRDLNSELQSKADPDLMLDLEVSGNLDPQADFPDLEQMEQDMASSFFRLRINDRTRLMAGPSESIDAPEASVLSEFARRMEQRIKEASDEERPEWEAALNLGFHFLCGEDRD